MSNDQTKMEHPEAALSLGVGKPGDGLVIMYFQLGAQFRQRIEWAKDGEAFPLLKSFQWNASAGQNESIGSPVAPCQEVVKEDHGDRTVAMSIGRSDKSHWSASYQADPNVDHSMNQNECSILVEHACRLNDEQAELGSSFWLGEVSASLVDGKVHLDGKGHQWSLKPLDATEFQIDHEYGTLTARPNPDSIDPKRPTTVTWGWRIGKRTS